MLDQGSLSLRPEERGQCNEVGRMIDHKHEVNSIPRYSRMKWLLQSQFTHFKIIHYLFITFFRFYWHFNW